MQIVRGPGSSPPTGSAERLVTVGGYVALFLVGVMEGLIGCFQYSRALGTVPVAAIAFAILVGVTCVLGAWGMHRPMGGLMPGVGWFVTSFVLAMGTPGGSVVITNSGAGQWFLYGGGACAVAGAVTGFVRWPSPRRRADLRPVPPWRSEFPPAARREPGTNAVSREARDPQAPVGDQPEADAAAELDARSADARSADARSADPRSSDARSADARKPDR